MVRPDGIPEDVWKTARECLGHTRDPQTKAVHTNVVNVARAILAERERCALKAETFFPPAHTYASENADIYHAQDSAAAAIAIAIRKGAP